MRASVATFIAGLLLSLHARAGEKEDRADELKLDFAVPDVPAFSVLNVSPSNISRPGSVRELVLAVANGLTPTGRLQSGLAVEVSPVKLVLHDDDQVMLTVWKRALAGFRVSLASNAAAKDNETTTSLAVGLRWSISSADTDLAELDRCLTLSLPKARTTPPPGAEPPVDEAEPQPAVKLPRIAGCRQLYARSHLAHSSLELAAAYSSSAVNDASLSALEPDTLSLWASASLGWNSMEADYRQRLAEIGRSKSDAEAAAAVERPDADPKHTPFGFEPLVFARIDFHHAASGLDGTRDLRVSGRLPLYWDAVGVFVEAGATITDVTKTMGDPKVKAPVGIGADVRVANGVWLSMYFGGDADSGDVFALSNLKWSISPQRSMTLN